MENLKDGYKNGEYPEAVNSRVIKSQSDVDQFLKEEGLDFRVEKFQEKNPFTNELRNSWGCYRTDNKFVFRTGLGNTFTPFQNKEAFQAISGLAGAGEVKIARAGVWNGGAETFIQCDINGGLNIGGKKDVVTQRISYINRNDGEGSCRIFITPFRPVCRNQLTTLRKLSYQSENSLKIYHTKSGELKLQDFHRHYAIIEDTFRATGEVYNTLADTKITEETVAEVLNRIAPVLGSKKQQEANKKKQQTIAQFVSDADSGFVAWDTAWNLINAITRYTSHVQGGFSNKEKSLLIGSGRDYNFDALEVVSDVCGVEF